MILNAQSQVGTDLLYPAIESVPLAEWDEAFTAAQHYAEKIAERMDP